MEKYAILIFGRGLDSPVYLPLRHAQHNNADVLMAELEKLGQSDSLEGVDKRTLLLSHPIKIVITCVNPPSGSGYVSRLQKFKAIRTFGVDDRHRIQTPSVNNPFCMFYALLLSLRFLDQKILTKFKDKKEELPIPENELMSKYSFRRFRKNERRMLQEVKHLMNEAKVPPNERKYGISQLEAVQEYFDRRWPDLYRIVAFEDAPEIQLRPIWKGKETRHFLVPIFLQNDHWDGIKKIHKFFQLSRKYCIDCEGSYDADVNHRYECSARCYYCSSIGIGYPCPKEESIIIDCSNCNRTFFNKRYNLKILFLFYFLAVTKGIKNIHVSIGIVALNAIEFIKMMCLINVVVHIVKNVE